jgi:hypothetical protein
MSSEAQYIGKYKIRGWSLLGTAELHGIYAFDDLWMLQSQIASEQDP